MLFDTTPSHVRRQQKKCICSGHLADDVDSNEAFDGKNKIETPCNEKIYIIFSNIVNFSKLPFVNIFDRVNNGGNGAELQMTFWANRGRNSPHSTPVQFHPGGRMW